MLSSALILLLNPLIASDPFSSFFLFFCSSTRLSLPLQPSLTSPTSLHFSLSLGCDLYFHSDTLLSLAVIPLLLPSFSLSASLPPLNSHVSSSLSPFPQPLPFLSSHSSPFLWFPSLTPPPLSSPFPRPPLYTPTPATPSFSPPFLVCSPFSPPSLPFPPSLPPFLRSVTLLHLSLIFWGVVFCIFWVLVLFL